MTRSSLAPSRLLALLVTGVGLVASGCAPGAEEGGDATPSAIRARAAELVVEATIPELHAALRSGDVTCRAVVRAYLDRIAVYDSASGVHAITVVNPRAVARADSLDRLLAAIGDGAGAGSDAGDAGAGVPPRDLPLFCVPMLVKDNFDTHDLPTTGGSVALAGSRPPDDAFLVRRIREAGAVVVAKTNMAEWAFSPRQTVSSSYGTTANAYDPSRVPAGSSGGTASGVAASFGLAGLGSDTGNSIRGPGSHLALFGIRSTLGLTSRDGIIPLFFDRDVGGPMTRTVADGARIFQVIAGHDPADPYTRPARERREDDYTAFLDAEGLAGSRIGVLRALSDPAGSDSAVLRLFDRAVSDVEGAGAEIVDPFTIPSLAEHLERDYTCPRFRYDMARYLESLGPDAPLRDVRTALEEGLYSPHAERALRALTTRPADVHPADWDSPCPDYADHPGRRAFLTDVVAAMDAAGVDAVVYPTWTHPPARLDRGREEYRGDNSQLIAPATGMPAVTVPMGFTEGRHPAGLQFLGRPWDDGLLIGLAHAYERATLHRRPPEGFPPLETP